MLQLCPPTCKLQCGHVSDAMRQEVHDKVVEVFEKDGTEAVVKMVHGSMILGGTAANTAAPTLWEHEGFGKMTAGSTIGCKYCKTLALPAQQQIVAACTFTSNPQVACD